MRLYEFSHQLGAKFIPMDDTSRNELLGESILKYKALVSNLQHKEKQNVIAVAENEINKGNPDYKPLPVLSLTSTEKLTKLCEEWYMRYIFQVLFIILVPMIDRYMNSSMHEEEEAEDPVLEYLRYKTTKEKL